MPKTHAEYTVRVYTRISEALDTKLTRLESITAHTRSDLSRHLYEVSSIYTFPLEWTYPPWPPARTTVKPPLTAHRRELLVLINFMVHQLHDMQNVILRPNGEQAARVLHLDHLVSDQATALVALEALVHSLVP